MFKTPLTLLMVAAAALAGCDQSDHNITAEGPYDPQANAVANSAPVTMPPSIVASHPYRCKDNSLVSIDWLSDGKANSARATPKGGAAVALVQAERERPLYCRGLSSLTGDPRLPRPSPSPPGKSCAR